MNDSGNEYLTTAWHCVDGLESAANTTGDVEDGAGDALGVWKRQASWVKKAYDVTLVKPNGVGVGSSLYRGDAWSSDHIGLVGATTSVVGQTVCIDGANSGSHCAVEIMAKNEAWNSPASDATALAGNVRARSVSSGAVAAVAGDSGGPVYQHSSNGYYGLGSISRFTYGSMLVTCPSTGIAHPTTTCTEELIYTSLTGALSAFDAEVK